MESSGNRHNDERISFVSLSVLQRAAEVSETRIYMG
nr:MAG TPA: hypothetical protein [Caudoviricetes sp.]